MSGSGATTLGPGCTGTIDNGTAFKILDGRIVNNNGSLVYTATSLYVRTQNGAVINNLSGGTFDIQSDGTVIDLLATPVGTFNNSGTLVKSAGTGNSTIEMAFNNTSTGSEAVDVQSGTLSVNVLALAPRKCVAVAGSDKTAALMRDAGVELTTIPGAELCRKAEGGPTCLTRPIWRA